MTASTQAQIEAAKEIDDYVRKAVSPWTDWRGHGPYILGIITAAAQVGGIGSFPEDDPRPGAFHRAAQVGEPTILVSDEQTQAAVITAAAKAIYEATIERCAQVVKEISQQEWDLTARAALEQAYIAIRKLAEPQLEPQSSMYQQRPDFVFPEEEP